VNGAREQLLRDPVATAVKTLPVLQSVVPLSGPDSATPGGPLTPGCVAVGGPPGHPWRPDYTLRRYGAAAGE